MGQKLNNQDIARIISRQAQDDKSLIYVKDIKSYASYVDTKNYFKILTDDEFQEFIYKFLLASDVSYQKNITINMVKDIAGQIHWSLPKTSQNVLTDYVALKDGIINLKTFEIEAPSRDKNVFFYVNCSSEEIERGYSKDDLWIKFINEVIVDKNKKPHEPTIRLVQEMFGYFLLNTLDGQMSFFLQGKGANGKSVMLKVLKNMIGSEFCAALTVNEMTMDQFA